MPAWRKVGIGILVWLLTAYCSPLCAARSLSITSNTSSLFGDEEVTISASASGFTDGETIYIKGALYQEGSTNYFGYTKKDSDWIKNGETTTNQRSVIIGQWDQNLVVKSDFTDSGFKGEGDYKLKVGFYYMTSGGNLSGVNWSNNNVTVSLNEPDPTPSNSPTPTNTPTNTPANTPTSAHTPTSTPKPTATPTPTKEVTPTPEQGQTGRGIDDESENRNVLGVESESNTTPSAILKRPSSYKTFIITFLFISLGCAILSLAVVLRKQFFPI